MKKCVIYARVSTDEQVKSGRSIPDQIAVLSEKAKTSGYSLLKAFKDEGFSGSNPNRPALQEMLAFCQRHKVERILVVDTDRIARDENLHFALKAILKKAGIKLESLNQPMIDDSPEGSFMDTIIAAVNAFQPKVTGRKASMSMDEKAKSGWWPGWAPLGYLNQVSSDAVNVLERNIIVVDPGQSALITRAFNLYATGTYSLDRLCDQMYSEGLRSRTGKKLTKNHMAFTLKNVFYTGKFLYKGAVLPGKHEALIDDSIYQNCQRILAEHNRYADRTHKHASLLNGLVQCGICKRSLTSDYHPIKHKAYYHCPVSLKVHSNKGQNIEMGLLELKVSELFKHITLPQEIIDSTIAKAQNIFFVTHNDIDSQRRNLQAQVEKLRDRHDKLDEKLLDNVMSDESYQRQSLVIRADIGAAESELAKLNGDREENMVTFRRLLLLARNVHQAYTDAPMPLKRRYLALFWDQIIIQDRIIKEAVPTKALQAALQESDQTASVLTFSNWLPGSDSN